MTGVSYFVETRYTVTERFRIVTENENEARRIAKSNDVEPYESVKSPTRVTCSWPLPKEPDDD